MSAPILPNGHPVGAPTSLPMSPAQAAHQAQVSRRTIMRAIEAGILQAFRDNKNRWQIDSAELSRWADAQLARTEPYPSSAPISAHSETTLQLAVAQVTISQLEARLQAAERDRDQWRSMAEKLAEPPLSTPLRHWWWPF